MDTQRKVEGTYYLAPNKRLVFTRGAIPKSTLRSWQFSTDQSSTAVCWRIATEALALGCDQNQIERLMGIWGLDNDNGAQFAKGCGVATERSFANGMWYVGIAKGSTKELKTACKPTLVEALSSLLVPGIYVQGVNNEGRETTVLRN